MKIVLSFIVIMLLGLHTLPFLVRDQVVIWLREHGAQDARFEAIKIHWLTGVIELKKLSATSPDTPPIHVGAFDLGIDYAALFEKRVLVKQLTLSDVRTGLYQKENALWLGPINLSALSQDKQSEPETDSPLTWRFGVQSVAIDSLQWEVDVPPYKQNLALHKATLNSLLQWDAQAVSALALHGTLNGSAFDLQSAATPLSEQQMSKMTLKLDRLPLESVLSPWLPQVKGLLTTDLTVNVNLHNMSGEIEHDGEFKIANFHWQDQHLNARNKTLFWQGQGRVKLDNAVPNKVTLVGHLKSQKTTLKQKQALELALAQLDWRGDVGMVFSKGQLNQVTGKHHIEMDQFHMKQADLSLAMTRLTQQGPLSLALNDQGLASLSAQLDAKATEFSLVQPNMQLALATVGVASEAELAWQKAALATITAQPNIHLQGVNFRQPTGLDIRAQSANIQANMHAMAPSNPEISGVQLTLQQLDAVAGKTAPLTLATLKQLSLQDGQYSARQIAANRIDLSGLKANYHDQSAPMLSADQMALTRLNLNDLKRLVIDSIMIRDTTTRVTVTKAQKIKELERFQAALANLSDGRSTSKKTPPASAESPMTVHIGTLALAEANHVHFADYSVKPRFKSNTNITQLQVKNIDTGSAKQSQFRVKATINKRARLALDGHLNLFSGDKNGAWTFSMNNMQLPVVSPYTGKYIGYYMRSGKMAFTSDVELKKSQLSGTNHISLSRIKVQPAQNSATGKFNQQLSMPLGTAIAVLEDDNDNIKLDVPVEGSLDDPKFGYQSIIERLAKKGLKKAAFSFLTKSLQPYGALISLAKTAIDANESGAFINLAPVGFLVGETTPQNDANDYVVKVADMLKKRDALHLNICGHAVVADKPPVSMRLEEENKQRAKPLTPEELNDQLADKLQALAHARGEIVMDMLLKQGVPQDQLFSCFSVPDMENAELKPSVSLSL